MPDHDARAPQETLAQVLQDRPAQVVHEGQAGLVHLSADVDGQVHVIGDGHNLPQLTNLGLPGFGVLDVPVAVRDDIQRRRALGHHALQHGPAVLLSPTGAVEPGDHRDRVAGQDPLDEVIHRRECVLGGLHVPETAALGQLRPHQFLQVRGVQNRLDVRRGLAQDVRPEPRGPLRAPVDLGGLVHVSPDDVALGGGIERREGQHVEFVVDGDVRHVGIDAVHEVHIPRTGGVAVGAQTASLGRPGRGHGDESRAHDIRDPRLARRGDIHVRVFLEVHAGLEVHRGAQAQELPGGQELLETVEHVEVAQPGGIQASLVSCPGDVGGRPAVGVVREERVEVHVQVVGGGGGGHIRRGQGFEGFAAGLRVEVVEAGFQGGDVAQIRRLPFWRDRARSRVRRSRQDYPERREGAREGRTGGLFGQKGTGT